jgi:SAM-dependent methyltransferase
MSVVEREFNALADEYETNRLAPWYKAHADEILAHCPSLAHGNILDVGCGSGYLLRSFLRHNPGAGGIGIDIAPGMIERARRLASDEDISGVRFIRADWETFDTAELGSDPVRIAVCANAFHYFSSPARAAGKLMEALADDGVLFVLERDKSGSTLTRAWGWLHRHCIKDNVEFYDRRGLMSYFSNAGFGTVTVVRTINRLFWKNKLYTSIVLIKCLKQ